MVVEQAVVLGRALERIGWMVATAESCTGGLIACALTEIGGSSVWFERGFVTYSNDAKQACLGVEPAALIEHGAVSEETARQMARGALANSKAQLALAVTGIAGPGGAVEGKPVGTVCFGWATATRIESQTRCFDGDRAAVRAQTALHALREALRLLDSSGATTALA
ncbi:MAG: CinA family protein [Burkholderiaceae bacterium]